MNRVVIRPPKTDGVTFPVTRLQPALSSTVWAVTGMGTLCMLYIRKIIYPFISLLILL